MVKIISARFDPLRGRIQLPGDKSIAHRALILGALAEGGLDVIGLPGGQDVLSTRRCLEQLGVGCHDSGDGVVHVEGQGGQEPLLPPAADLDCGNSGTTMRLLAGVLSGQPFESRLVGDDSLSRRPMSRLSRPLSRMGARIELSDGEHAPISITGRRPLEGTSHRLNIPSAQLKSAILLAGLFAEGPTSVEGAIDTRDHTERMLAWLTAGAAIGPGQFCTLQPTPLKGDRRLIVPGDISSAAFLVVAAALVPGSRVEFSGVGLNPSRTAYLGVLERMGVPITFAGAAGDGEDWSSGEPIGDLVVEAAKQMQAITTSAREARHLIDEIPILAVAATQAYGRSRFTGLGELRYKESDRLAGIAAGLVAMGATVEVIGDDLVIDGPCRLRGAPVATLGDHRLAMAFTVAGMSAKGETEIDEHTCITVSFPGFWSALESLTRVD